MIQDSLASLYNERSSILNSICKGESVGLCCQLEISGPQRAEAHLKLGDKRIVCFLN